MKVAICDDEKVFHKEITNLLRKFQKLRNIDIFIDYYESGDMLLGSKYEYDVIFMDYQMEKLNGIETAKKLRRKNSDSIIIFISAYPAAALDAFEVNTFRFLKKPIDETKLFKALDDYLKSIDYDNLLLIKTHEGIYKVKISEIIYLEGDGRYTIIRSENQSLRVRANLKQLELKLPASKFTRCSKSFVVGFGHIINHDSTNINFDNGEKAVIGTHYVTKFKSEFQNYIMKYNEVHMV
ncbi:MAG: LytTR family DNA-binding domain-containing protein [Oscillospiraceae bacterium]|nr:LytTR family DNA-binding domain-containing protein [Oscillospiraceae bacterium]